MEDTFNLAARLIQEKGWVREEAKNRKGYCTVGAIREQDNGYIAEQIAVRRGFDLSWNDAPGRTKREVVEALQNLGPITDEDLERTFGPQYREIVDFVERAKNLTSEEVDGLRDAWLEIYNAVGDASFEAARPPVGDPDRYAAWNSLWAALYNVAGRILWNSSWNAVRDAGIAVCLRDRMDKGSYDALTGPWRKVIGNLHPDDAPIPAEAQA